MSKSQEVGYDAQTDEGCTHLTLVYDHAQFKFKFGCLSVAVGEVGMRGSTGTGRDDGLHQHVPAIQPGRVNVLVDTAM